MHCPHCLEELKVTERQGVEIDYCPKCRGVWLDRGELDKIIERSLQTVGPQPTGGGGPEYSSHSGQPYHGKHKKRKSFLEELFDFD
ncbi:MAG: zf-TFIIB domain-containing protein [Calditrichaceae bacterium]|nr:zf-TFIIB domain-containing protein [Calditrichia bacterium]NUQ41170.1 zf-TFIIB domain-containing protein [Calditrichaceae bacterium]